MVVLQVATFSVVYAISHNYETATFAAATFATFATFAAVFATVVVATFTAVATFAAVAVATFAAAAFAFVIAEKENLPLWRVLAVLAGEAGAIAGWMLIFQHSLPLAVLALAAGVGVMALAAFIGVRELENAEMAA